ncbi:sulfite exporter TauE/SafE family protein [Hymenobacter sp. 15J16-1T3B]|uniref:sulfite exporter TauE/SafE family protein n=1 Tax=Hymenobacter sp. 15J16-1T3B TaxID=2886941 RepID=UPI001D0F7061|nr:sulfite exporter TauE/SafE family protein [Hymenobacter sp. 15J16-1T3B]MCC3159768.1 sulfite exporter TauE/SafE family protein [Hymenobacter sp. 15J16-1T3B]
MTVAEAALLFGAAVVGGGLNAVAGGGGFLAILPPLIAARVPPLSANAMIAVALWPGLLTSVAAARPRPRLPRHRHVGWLLLLTVTGAVAGASLLLRTPPTVFLHLVPFLLLASTLLFAGSGHLLARHRVDDHLPETTHLAPAPTAGGLLSQLLIGVYGGYFGANLGLVLLAALGLAGMHNRYALNLLRTQLVLGNGAAAAAVFAASGLLLWPQTLVLLAGTVAGGWAGSRHGHRLDGVRLHAAVVAAGLVVSGYLFVIVYLLPA